MADNKNISDEDYLDSLLKSVTSSQGKYSSNLFDDELDDDFVKSIENDLKTHEDEDNFLNEFENDMFMSSDSSNPIDESEEPKSIDEVDISPQKKKKKLFGNKKKNSKKDLSQQIANSEIEDIPLYDTESKDNPNSVDKVNSIDDLNLSDDVHQMNALNSIDELNISNASGLSDDLIISDASDISDSSDISDASGISDDLDINNASDSLNIDDIDSFGDELGISDFDIVDSDSTNVADAVADALSETDASSPEEDINGLMEILGASDDESKEKGKKAKKSKRSLFKKKKKNDDSLNDDKANISETDVDGLSRIDESGVDVTTDGSLGNEDAALDDLALNDNFATTEDTLNFGISLDDMGFGEEEKTLDENEELIRKMDNGEIDEEELLDDEEKEDDKKKKKEKKKKEKKPKVKKEKKPKKIKVKKPKKPDVIIPIPRVFLFFSLSFIVLLSVFLIFGGKLYYYNNQMQKATAHYVNKDYNKAYDELSGMKLKESDMAFYNQVQTIMFVMHHYEQGIALAKLNNYEHGLDELIKGVSCYDKYQNIGRNYDCYDEMTEVLSWIDYELENTYGLSESEARELSLIEDRVDYAYKVRVLAKAARENNNTEEQPNDSNN